MPEPIQTTGTSNETGTQSRRRRPVAFFEPEASGSDSPIKMDKEAAQERLADAQTITSPSILTTFLVALPFIALMIYLFTPHSAFPPETTPLTPLLKSLSGLIKLFPALPYVGLATHILSNTLSSTKNMPAEVLELAQEAKTKVEILSADEEVFRSGVLQSLEVYLSGRERTEAEMKEGYEGFFVGTEAEAGELIKQAEVLKPVLARLGSGLKGYGKEGEPANIVEWIAVVVGKSSGVFENIVERAKKGRKILKETGRDWNGEAVLKQERREVKKYIKKENSAGVVLDAIAKEYFEGDAQAAVENKLKKAIAKGNLNWW